MSQSLLLILGGCLLGAFQLVVGVAIGMWVRRDSSADARRERQELLQAGLIASRLKTLADELSTSAHQHRSKLEQASQLLTAGDVRANDALTELVVDVIGDIVRANQSLQAQLETAEHRLENQAVEIEAHISRSLTDPLTGLPNRREFDERLEERLAAWNRRREIFSLMLLDVDHFKKLNDEHGHVAGDLVLAAIGRTLRAAVRREDAVARYGGEELAILMSNTSLDQAMCVAEKVRQAVARLAIEHNDQSLQVTLSGGLAVVATDDSAESIVQRADAALYAAKAAGRNRICVHDPSGAVSSGELTTRLAQIIRAADGEKYAPPAALPVAPVDVGTFLERDAVSAQLAQTCDELRRLVAERTQRKPGLKSICDEIAP